MAGAPDQSALKALGYQYEADGVLRSTENQEKFKFIDQTHYEKLGDAVELYIRDLLQAEPYNLQAVPVPKDASPTNKDPHALIYMSPDAMTADNLFLVIQGSGAVRPGQWARALCINDSLEVGTIFPYLDEIRKRKSGVIVLNPNENTYLKRFMPTDTGAKMRIPSNGSAEEHTLYVYDTFVKDAAKAKRLYIIAHSYGGVSTMNLLENRPEILDTLQAVVFTDSVHGRGPPGKSDLVRAMDERNIPVVNFVKSDLPLKADLGSDPRGIKMMSAGAPKHEWTSHAAKVAAWELIDSKF